MHLLVGTPRIFLAQVQAHVSCLFLGMSGAVVDASTYGARSEFDGLDVMPPANPDSSLVFGLAPRVFVAPLVVVIIFSTGLVFWNMGIFTAEQAEQKSAGRDPVTPSPARDSQRGFSSWCAVG